MMLLLALLPVSLDHFRPCIAFCGSPKDGSCTISDDLSFSDTFTVEHISISTCKGSLINSMLKTLRYCFTCICDDKALNSEIIMT